MLGRKNYTLDEFDHGQAAIREQLSVYKKLAGEISSDHTSQSALAEFEELFFNTMTLMLDRLYIHRLRIVSGKDCNPLNEVELICDSLIDNDGIFRAGNVIKYIPEKSVLKLKVGDRIHISRAGFERLSAGFFTELESKFLE
jgi:hypothetical protein